MSLCLVISGTVSSVLGIALAAGFAGACGSTPNPPGTGGAAGAGPAPTDAGVSDAQSQTDAAPDAGPLAECLPPCLRQALTPCLPILNSCFSEREPADAAFPAPYSDKICAADSSWSHETAYAFHSIIQTIEQNGSACFSSNTQWGSGFGPFVRYFDSSGAQVAFGAGANNGSGDTIVFCTSGTPSPTDPGYTLGAACPLPTNRCQTTTAGSCP